VAPGQSAAATVAAIREQDGVAVAAHPFWRTERQSRAARVGGVGGLGRSLDLHAIEVENGTPGFYIFNQMARRLNQAAGRAEAGGSDAHILDAIGRASTAFPGETPGALRVAIEGRRTRAVRQPYPAVALFRYAAWGIDHKLQQRRAGIGR
jgi:predicted metal-dependent phosphoesterase TrpH